MGIIISVVWVYNSRVDILMKYVAGMAVWGNIKIRKI